MKMARVAFFLLAATADAYQLLRCPTHNNALRDIHHHPLRATCIRACDTEEVLMPWPEEGDGSEQVIGAQGSAFEQFVDDIDVNDIELPPDMAALEGQQLDADDMQCSGGRIVTELRAADKTELPDRFMYAVRAIRGDFTQEGSVDTEYVEDSITSALLNFPATVTLRVVTKPMPSPEAADELRDQLSMLFSTLEGAEGAPEVCETERGARRSFDFRLKVPDAYSLSVLRNAIKEDERVQMVF